MIRVTVEAEDLRPGLAVVQSLGSLMRMKRFPVAVSTFSSVSSASVAFTSESENVLPDAASGVS